MVSILRYFYSRYTSDVISSCAFGLEGDSLDNANSEFQVKSRAVVLPTLRRRLFDFLLNTCPKLLWLVGHTRLSRDVIDFFTNLVEDTIEYRKKNGVVRKDFLDILLKLKEEDEDGQQSFGKLKAVSNIVLIYHRLPENNLMRTQN